MAWNAPKTWVDGEIIGYATLNLELRDKMLLLKTSIDAATGLFYTISSAYFTSLDGSALTGVTLLGAANTYTAGIQNFNGATTRFVLPFGVNQWAV